MKHIVPFILIAILMGSTIGLSISEHYCHDSLAITSIGIDSSNSCACPIPMDDDCCKEVTTFYSLIGNFNLAQASISSQPTFELIQPIKFNTLAIAHQPLNFNVFKDAIRPLAESKVFLMVQSFLL